MEKGTKVKYSNYALQHSRDYYLNQGQPTKKAQAKELFEEKKALRGIIIEKFKTGYVIQWETGAISKTASYMIEEE